ncbi:MAG: glutamate racemase, partial [Bacillota bacterium]
NFIFYGDLANAPYGEKSREFIEKRASEIFDFFIEQQAKTIVIACNTATSAAVKYLRSKYADIDILGMEPAVQLAVNSGEQRIVLLSTPITANAPNTLRLIKDNREKADIINIPCKGLMDLVENSERLPEEENHRRIKAYLQKKTQPHLSAASSGAVVLGCTHYIFLRDILHEMFPKIRLYDGNEGTAKNLIRHLQKQNLLNPQPGAGSMEFFSSVNEHEFQAKALRFLEKMDRLRYPGAL